MRLLYFDIDGTLLMGNTGEPKAALADGAFEKAVRRCGVDRLVCVGNFIDAVRALEENGPSYNGIHEIFSICKGVFSDESWFQENISLVENPLYRAREVNLEEDWWYIDDLAEHYFQIADREIVFQLHNGGRIMIPSPDGDGSDVIAWLNSIEKLKPR